MLGVQDNRGLSRPNNKTAVTVTAVALAVAGGAHIAAYGQHLSEGAVVAAFFAAVAALQIAASLLVLRGAGARLRAAIVVANLALVALWAWSRTTGLKFGPTAGEAEAVGVLDLVAVAGQAVAVVSALLFAHRSLAARLLRPQLALVAVALLVGTAGLRLPVASADHHHPQTTAPAHEVHEAEEHSH